MKFYCDCKMHYIDLDRRPIKFKGNKKILYVGLTIYEHRSGNSGKLFKKPIELGTVVLIGKQAKDFKAALASPKGLEE